MSSSYRALLARPGARSLALCCWLGWLSFASYGLAIVLAVRAATGSFVVAGAAVGVFSAGAALFAPVRGRFVDRRGPRALASLAPAHALALALLVFGCASAAPPGVLVWCAALAGAFAPPLIAVAHSLWPQVSGPGLIRTSHALNTALGDAAQVLGPALTGAIAALASPLIALGLLVPGASVGALILARSTAPVERDAPRPLSHRVWGVLADSSGLRTIVMCELGMGIWLGALEVAAPAIAAEQAAAELAAVPLAVFAAGSLAGSLWSGSGRPQRAATWRYLAGSLILAAILPLCLVTRSLAGITVVLAIAGAGFALLNVAVFELLDQVVPPDRAVEAFTWLTTWQGAGAGAGALGAGQLTRGGISGTLILVAVPAALAAALALARRATLPNADSSRNPSAPAP